MIDLIILIYRHCASNIYYILILPQHTLTFLTDGYDSEKGGFSQVKYKGPALYVGLKADAMAICDRYAKLVQRYNEGNEALKDSDLLTEANARKQAVINCIGVKLNLEKKHKMVESLFKLPNNPETEKQLYVTPCVWQGVDYIQVPETDLVKITGRLTWAFAKTKIGNRSIPMTRFYILWELAVAGSERVIFYTPTRKEDKPDDNDFIKQFATFFNQTDFDS